MDKTQIAIARELQQIGQCLAEIGAALTKTLTLPIVELGPRSVKAALEFEASFAGVLRG